MYTIGITRDFLNVRDEFAWGDIGLSRIEQHGGMRWAMVATDQPERTPDALGEFDALLVLRQRIDADLLAAAPRLRHVSRWGAGLDRIDLDACTRAGVIVTSTPFGGKRPVAAAAITLMLALTHRLLQKDRLVRDGKWDQRADHMGMGLTGRTIGIVGLGHIGRDIAHLLSPFAVRTVAYSPRASREQASDLGVTLVALDELLASSDVVIVAAALTPATHGLLSAEKLAQMKPSAYIVNVARGEIIDQAALAACLAAGRIAGAGLDVFQDEPLPTSSPLIGLDNVILAPHALAWTDEIIAGNAVDAIGSLVKVCDGQRPDFIANPAVLDHPRLRELLR
ncbi:MULTISPECIES: NAD(P)-dependent oxidoreductase [unclassified Chelatococcus]|uniref:NAD(P)-dependent oxidoreductase n=1 Tax=unclassified Chelatococcus TaxID=2638111 RepID=UPI001BCA6C0C|nr:MULTISPECIES: NAD(P)-dependent oxidoreductase [unclassified Chelatococcus]MBS7700357.1 dehydrogenase [Chelatococcus sp. YT9]MBX3556153.1 dehydrogenase [Chelatococcus sp.]